MLKSNIIVKVYNLTNGHISFVHRTNRRIQLTSQSVTIGGQLNSDHQPNLQAGEEAVWSISCLQLYDVALTQIQIRKTMNLCKKTGELMKYLFGHAEVQNFLLINFWIKQP